MNAKKKTARDTAREQLVLSLLRTADRLLELVAEVEAAAESGAITEREAGTIGCAVECAELELQNARPRLVG